MTASALMLILAFSTFALGSAEAQDSGSGGGYEPTSDATIDYDESLVKPENFHFSDGTLKITNLNLIETDGPGISILSGTVKLVLNGSNTIVGGPEYAGIYVAIGATLVITAVDSESSLNVSGGDGGNVAGAGIGGNGYKGNIDTGFGKVVIESGNIIAHGGDASNAGGAGIGSGGVIVVDNGIEDYEFRVDGFVHIIGGNITAYGGYDTPSGYCGGAGIGSGGMSGNSHSASYIDVRITEGNIEANGAFDESKNQGCDAAGISGGSNINVQGTILIEGGTVKAHGTSDSWVGGAGIGGGDNGNGYVEITGGKITASTDAIGAAVIGGGHLGSGVVNISGGSITVLCESPYASAIGGGYGEDLNGSGTVNISGGTISIISSTTYYSAIGDGLNPGFNGEVNISGGTIFISNSTEKGNILNSKSITITGGSINADGTTLATNGESTVYRVDIQFDGISTQTEIKSINIDGYGMTDVYTDSTGSIYVWLPEDTVLELATIGEQAYAPEEPYTVTTGVNEVTFFEVELYSITITETDNGTISSSYSSAAQGTEVTLTVTPDEGYKLSSINSDDVTITGSDGEYTFTMPASDVTVTATFIVATHTVTFYNDDVVHHEKEYNHGELIVLPEEPSKDSTATTDYKFTGWNGYSEGMLADDDYTFYAQYEESVRLYEITFMSNGSVFDRYELAYGAEITTPDTEPEMSGYDFVGWDGYTTGMTVTSDHTFTAVFEETAVPFPPYFPDDDEWFPIYPGGGGGTADDDITTNTGGLTDEELSVLLMTLAIICALFAIFLLILAKRRKDDEENERS